MSKIKTKNKKKNPVDLTERIRQLFIDSDSVKNVISGSDKGLSVQFLDGYTVIVKVLSTCLFSSNEEKEEAEETVVEGAE